MGTSVATRNVSYALTAVEYIEQLLKASPQVNFSKESLLQLTSLVKEDLQLVIAAAPSNPAPR